MVHVMAPLSFDRLGRHCVAYMLWFGPCERQPERTVVRDGLSYDGICEGRTGTLIPSGRGNLETNRETLFTAPTVSSEQTVKAEHLNFAEARETQNKQCAEYGVPLCCSHKDWLTFWNWEDWDLMQEKRAGHTCMLGNLLQVCSCS